MEDNKYIVGLDLGSISVNAVVIDTKGDIMIQKEILFMKKSIFDTMDNL